MLVSDGADSCLVDSTQARAHVHANCKAKLFQLEGGKKKKLNIASKKKKKQNPEVNRGGGGRVWVTLDRSGVAQI